MGVKGSKCNYIYVKIDKLVGGISALIDGKEYENVRK